MTFIPSPDYVEKFPGRINKIPYLQRDKDLEGWVLFHHWGQPNDNL